MIMKLCYFGTVLILCVSVWNVKIFIDSYLQYYYFVDFLHMNVHRFGHVNTKTLYYIRFLIVVR